MILKLSRAFYEKFGDEFANELVGWMNQVYDNRRSPLPERSDLSVARFDARMDERFAVSTAMMELRFALAEAKMDQRFAASEARLIGWMFAFWFSNTVALVLFVALLLHTR